MSVYYTGDRPFLIPEEQNMLNALAESLGVWLQRKQMEEALKESEEKYRTLIENMVDVKYSLDAAGNIVSVNKALKTMFGFEP